MKGSLLLMPEAVILRESQTCSCSARLHRTTPKIFRALQGDANKSDADEEKRSVNFEEEEKMGELRATGYFLQIIK